VSKNDARPAVKDLIDAIRGVFKNYSRETRDKAWHKGILTQDGRKAIEKMIKNPKVPITGTSRFLNFKEWLNS
jgi:hypothetical protein